MARSACFSSEPLHCTCSVDPYSAASISTPIMLLALTVTASLMILISQEKPDAVCTSIAAGRACKPRRLIILISCVITFSSQNRQTTLKTTTDAKYKYTLGMRSRRVTKESITKNKTKTAREIK